MLIPLKIQKKKNSFGVTLDKRNNKFLFEGRSIPENVKDFFRPILKWLNQYKEAPLEETVVKMDFEYFNTSTSVLILEALYILDEIADTGKSVKIIWYYINGDFEMQEAGEEYEAMLNLPFEYIEHTKVKQI